MIRVSKELAIKILEKGEEVNWAKVYINENKSIEYNIYVKEYDNFIFTIAEDEDTDEYFAVINTDRIEPTDRYTVIKVKNEGIEILAEIVKLIEERKIFLYEK